MGTLPVSTTPIFTDGSGRRVVVVQWTARAFCLVAALVAGAVVFTLTTHVPLPGLDRIISPRTGPDASRTTTDGTDTAGRALVAGLPAAGTSRVVSVASAARNAAGAVKASRPTARQRDDRLAHSAGQLRAPQSAAPAPAAPQATASTPPPGQAKKGDPNPRAVAKGANSSVKAATRTTKTSNPKATAARTKPRPTVGPGTRPAAPQK